MAVVSLLVAAALAVGLWLRWIYSAHALGAAGRYRLTMLRPVGATVYSPSMVEPAGNGRLTLDVRSVTPNVTRNTADATITALICHRNNETSRLGSDDLSMCAWTKPFEPGVMTVGLDVPGIDSIIFKITSQHAGRVNLGGVHVAYRQGLRHGSQDTGGTFVLRAR